MLIKTLSSIFLLSIFVTISGHAQKTRIHFQADSIFIYKNFFQAGTTASLRYNHRTLDSTHAPKNKVRPTDLNELKSILKNTKRRILIQQKYGGEIYYMVVYYGGNKKRYLATFSAQVGILDDLESMKRWRIDDAKDRERFHNLIKSNCI